jgi:hypothetical protein
VVPWGSHSDHFPNNMPEKKYYILKLKLNTYFKVEFHVLIFVYYHI